MDCNEVICPVCNSLIKETDELIQCGKCGEINHKDCWEINNGCGNPKCGIKSDETYQSQSVKQSNSEPPKNPQNYSPAYTPSPPNMPYYNSTYVQQGYNTLNNNPAQTYLNNYNYGQYSQQGIPQRKKMSTGKKAAIICSIVFGSLAVIIIVFVFVIMGAVNNAKNSINASKSADSYNIGENSVPAMKSVVGERNITYCAKYIGTDGIRYQYNFQSASVKNDISEYSDYLVKNNNYKVTYSTSDRIQLAATAVESGKVLVIDINWNANSDSGDYIIYYRLIKGNLLNS